VLGKKGGDSGKGEQLETQVRTSVNRALGGKRRTRGALETKVGKRENPSG